jgi:hypothetical protein
MVYWRVYSLGLDLRIDVRGVSPTGQEADRSIKIACATIVKELGSLPTDIAKVWAIDRCTQWELYHHLPHHPQMIEYTKKKLIA